ncbi:hypothetical protein [Streptomyces sp. PU-14G]|uniref:hypothetical protein n=1 Tax=Streptomyces sp. PU-14G TaxID=2800808 RepID=UPI0034DDF19B
MAVVVGGTVVAGVTALVLALWSLSDAAVSEQDKKEKKCCWKEGVTSASLSREVGLRIPEEAKDKRAAYKTGSRYDTALLAFTLPDTEARNYVDRLKPSGDTLLRNTHPKQKNYRPTAPFARLDLPEPETLTKGVRRISLCPDEAALPAESRNGPEGEHLRHCVDLYTHEFKPGTTRVYLRSDIE